MKSTKEILEKKIKNLSYKGTVNSSNKSTKQLQIPTDNSVSSKGMGCQGKNKTTNPYLKKVISASEDWQGSSEVLASEIAKSLNDEGSLAWHVLVAKNNDPSILLEALATTLIAINEGKVKTKPVFYYKGILNRKRCKIKFIKE